MRERFGTVLGVGAALVDLLALVDDAWVWAQGDPKGGMALVDRSRMEKLLSLVGKTEVVPGGSACNTMRGLGVLGGRAAFLGKIGRDSLGELFSASLRRTGVTSHLLETDTPTGRVLSAVTPDAQRTMYTYLGASAEIGPMDLDLAVFRGAGLVYLEGYIAFNAPWFRAVVEGALTAGVPVGLDLGSVSVIEACREQLQWALDKRAVGVLIANEDEARAWCGLEGEVALRAMAASGATTAVLKQGERGAWILRGDETTWIPARKVRAVDTTGAGDLWASGFLFGLQAGWDLRRAGHLAAAVAAEVVQVMGPEIPSQGWERLRGEFAL